MNLPSAEAGPHEILLVEDNPADIALLTEVFGSGSTQHNIHVAADADQALAFLRREGEYAEARRPHLILLDLNLPGQSGLEVLAAIRRVNVFGRLPVVVITSSRSETDIRNCYDLHCNAYRTKPANFDGYVELARVISQYWLSSVILPSC